VLRISCGAIVTARRQVRQIRSKPGFRNRPLAHQRRLRDANHGGRFLDGQPAKIPKFDDALLTGTECGHALQRFVQGEDVGSRTFSRLVTGERNAFESSTALLSETCSCMIDENAAHQARRNPEEVRSVTPLDVPLVDEAHVGFVDESRWLERLSGDFTSHLSRGYAPKVVVDDRDQLIERLTSTLAHCGE
jgi:hypothetical protein